MLWFASSVNGGEDYARKYIQLTDDIALNDTADFETWETTPPANEWIPIGLPVPLARLTPDQVEAVFGS